MFQRGSHWVSARMSEVSKPVMPRHAASREQEAADETEPVALLPVTTEKDRPKAETLPVAANLYRDDAASAERDPPSMRHAGAPPSASRKDDAAERSPSDARDVPNSRQMLPVPTSFHQTVDDTVSARWMPRLFLAAVPIIAVLAIGAGRMGDENPKIARMDGMASELPPPQAGPAERDVPHQEEASASPTAKDVRPPEDRVEEQAPANGAPQTADPLRFADAALCTDTVCKTLVVHRSPDGLRPRLEPAFGTAVGVIHTTDAHMPSAPAAGPEAASPAPEPTETVVSRPNSETRDAPQLASEDVKERVLPIPLDELGEVEFVLLPRNGLDTARAEVALRQRDGRELARFNLKIDHTLVPDAPLARHDEEGDDEEEMQREEEREEQHSGASDDEAAPRETATEVAPTAVPASKRASRTGRKAAERRTKTPQRVKPAVKQPIKKGDGGLAVRPPAQRAPAARQPRGLFPLQPSPSPISEPASHKAAATARKKVSEVSVNDLASEPTPRTVGRPPGFETLMRLGGGFAVEAR